jgi:hypothetical protein
MTSKDHLLTSGALAASAIKPKDCPKAVGCDLFLFVSQFHQLFIKSLKHRCLSVFRKCECSRL